MAEADMIALDSIPVPDSSPTGASRHLTLKSSQIFNIPELLSLVSSFLTQRDACTFIKCSRACFQAAVGQVWDLVPNIEYLFALLPGTTFPSNTYLEITIVLTDSTKRKFERFEFYAPFVKFLELVPKYSGPENTSNWNDLVLYSQHKKLLPNLQYIFYYPGLTSHLTWLTILLSPTLLGIRHEDFSGCAVLGIDSASALIESIKVHCPRLEELSLYPVFSEDPAQLNGSILPVSPIYESYSALQNLRVLATSINFFDTSALLALARLPRLEKLEISEAYYCFDPMPAIILPDDSFPALRNLVLPDLVVDEISAIWTISQLVAKLNIVSISATELEQESDGEALVSCICDNSPYILDLALELSRPGRLSFNCLRFLKRVSLESLCIDMIRFPALNTSCDILADTCPLLRVLQLPRTKTSILDLRHFSKLSRLEYLHAGIDWESCVELAEVPEQQPTSYLFRRLAGGTPCKKMSPALVQQILQFLLSFWPELDSINMLCTAEKEGPSQLTSNLISQTLKAEQDAKRSRGGGSFNIAVAKAEFIASD